MLASVTPRPPGIMASAPAREARPIGERVASAVRAQDFAGAAKLYFELPSQATRHLLSPDDSIALGNWLARNGHAKAALVVYQRHLRDHPAGRGAAEAHAYAGLLQLHAFREPTAAYQHLVPLVAALHRADRAAVFGANDVTYGRHRVAGSRRSLETNLQPPAREPGHLKRKKS